VGFTSGMSSLQEARAQATKKAAAEVATYFGVAGRVSFVSTESESVSGHRYHVALELELQGEQITLRGIQLADRYFEEYRAGTTTRFDYHALVRYPRDEYERVRRSKRAEREARAYAALARYRAGLERTRAGDLQAASAAFADAAEILGALVGTVPLADGEIADTALLTGAIDRARRRLQRARRTLSIRVACTRDDAPRPCDDTAHALAEHAAAAGFVTVSSTAAIYALEAGLDVVHSSEAEKIFFARATGRFSLTENATGRIVATGTLAPLKGAHVHRGRAAAAVHRKAGRRLGIRVRKALRKL
jgi:hypothetical protein